MISGKLTTITGILLLLALLAILVFQVLESRVLEVF